MGATAVSFVMAEILNTVVTNLSVLQSIIKPSFGPRGIDVAVKAQSGSVLLTNSGLLILSSLSMSHPVCRLVSQQVDRHLGITGDGSKQMVIILSEFLKNIHQSMFPSPTKQCTSELSALSQACAYTISVQMSKVNKVLEECRKYEIIRMDNIDNVRKCIHDILKTAINGKVHDEAMRVLTAKTVDLIFAKLGLEQERFVNYVNNLIDQFKDVCIMSSGMSVMNTRTVDGFLIKSNLLGTIDSTKLGKPVKFVFLNEIVEVDDIQFGTTKFNCNYSQLNSFFESQITIIQSIVDVLRGNEIGLILCSSALPQHMKSIFKRQFLVVQHVHNEDIRRIANYCKIFPINTLSEIFSSDLDSHIGALSEISELSIGRECYLRLCPSEQYENEYPSCQLILHSAHQSITQQYYSIILNMLKIIKMCCYHNYGSKNQNTWSMEYLPSAGYAELKIAEYFAAEALNEHDMPLRTVYKSLSDALLEIPKLIYNNSSGTNKRFVDTQRLLEDFKSVRNNGGSVSFGINGENGKVFDPCKQNIIEPFSSKLLLLSHCLQAAQQILRIENILPARKDRNS